jgi:hypothetical protein
VFCVFGVSLKMNNKNVHFRHIMFFTLRKVRKLRKLKERFVPYTERMQEMNERAKSGLPGSVSEILISTMHHAQDGRSRLMTTKSRH